MARALAITLAPAGRPPGRSQRRRLTEDREPGDPADRGAKATARRQEPQLRAIHQPIINPSNPHGMAPPGRSLRVAAITPKSAPTSINHSGDKIVFNEGVIRIGFIFNARSWASWPTQPPFAADDRNAARAEGPSRSTADSALVWRCCGLGPGDHDPATSHQPQPGPPLQTPPRCPAPPEGGSPVKFH